MYLTVLGVSKSTCVRRIPTKGRLPLLTHSRRGTIFFYLCPPKGRLLADSRRGTIVFNLRMGFDGLMGWYGWTGYPYFVGIWNLMGWGGVFDGVGWDGVSKVSFNFLHTL